MTTIRAPLVLAVGQALLLLLFAFVAAPALAAPLARADPGIEKSSFGPNHVRLSAGATPVLDVELLDNTGQCLIDCWAVLRFHPHQDFALPTRADSDFSWDFTAENGPGLRAWSFERLQNVTTSRTFPNGTQGSELLPAWANGSVPSGCAAYDETRVSCPTFQPGERTESATREEWLSWSPWGETLVAGRDHLIRVRGTKPATLGPNDVDWIPTLKGIRLAEWAWWNSTWTFRKQLNVTDLSNTAFTDYPVVAMVDCGGFCNESGKDFRLVANDVQELQFGLNRLNATSYDVAFWVNVTAANATNGSYYLYYGNALASAANRSWNLSRYNYWDDFETGSVSGNLTVYNGTVAVQSATKYAGSYALSGIGSGAAPWWPAFLANNNWNVTDAGILIEAVKQDDSGDLASWDGFLVLGDTAGVTSEDAFRNSMRPVWSGENNRLDHRWYNASRQEEVASSTTSCSLGEGSWHVHRATWFRNNRTLASATSGCSLTTSSISSVVTGESTGRMGLLSGSQGKTYFDNWAFRKYLVPEPSVAVGSQENQSGGGGGDPGNATGANSTVNFTYDANGNRIKDGALFYEYNAFNQLAQVRAGNASGAVVERYFYDQDGNRAMKVHVPSNTTTYYPHRAFIRAANASGVYDWVHFFQGDAMVARKDPSGALLFNHPDHLGSTTLVTDSAGNVVENTTYEPYGAVFEGGLSRFLYTGKELDRGTGLEYYGARYYDPWLGMFAQADTLLPDAYDPQQLNRYAYVRDNPYKYTDPDGHIPLPIAAGLAAGVIAFAFTYYQTGDVGKAAQAGVIYGVGAAVGTVLLLAVAVPGATGLAALAPATGLDAAMATTGTAFIAGTEDILYQAVVEERGPSDLSFSEAAVSAGFSVISGPATTVITRAGGKLVTLAARNAITPAWNSPAAHVALQSGGTQAVEQVVEPVVKDRLLGGGGGGRRTAGGGGAPSLQGGECGGRMSCDPCGRSASCAVRTPKK